MSALSFLNLLLFVIHIAALAGFMMTCGVLIFQLVELYSRKKVRSPYQLIEVCITVLGYCTLALWLSVLPDALFLKALPARHFSVFGIFNLELLVLATGALIAIVVREQNRYPSRRKLIAGTLDPLTLRLMISSFFASFLMTIFLLTPDRFITAPFSTIAKDVITNDLSVILLLVTLLCFYFSANAKRHMDKLSVYPGSCCWRLQVC